jgi:hypothetical protein
MTEDILTIRDVAEYLKVTEKTVYGLAQKRKILCFLEGSDRGGVTWRIIR